MKKFLFIVGILISYASFGQTYTIKHSLDVRPGNNTYGDNCRNDMRVTLYYRIGGSNRQSDLYGKIDLNGGTVSMSGSFNVVGSNLEIIKVVTVSSRNWKRAGGCGGNGAFNDEREDHRINSKCSIYKTDIAKWWKANLSLTIEPKIIVSIPDGDESTTSCVTKGQQFNSSSLALGSKFERPNEFYRWEYEDILNPSVVPTDAYQRLIDAQSLALNNLMECYNNQPNSGSCFTYEQEYSNVENDIANFNGQQLKQVPNYKVLTNKIGQINPIITLRDIYPQDKDFNRAINKLINIRITTSCGITMKGISVIYLPEPPRISQEPKVIQPNCAYNSAGGAEIFLDRGIDNNEVLNFQLKKIASGSSDGPLTNIRTSEELKLGGDKYLDLVNKRYQLVTGDNVGITSTNSRYNVITKSYTWDGDIFEGEYAIIISGYQQGDNRTLQPVCEQSFYFFKIKAPERVSFSTKLIQNEQCLNAKDGKFEIAASGGTGTYSYIFNGTNWTGAKTFTAAQSPIIVENISPGTYNIQVRDSKGCYDLDELGDPLKTQRVVITAKQQIKHSISTSSTNPVHPGAPGRNDGSIYISSVSGGTPKSDRSGTFFDYIVLLNNSTTNTLSGRGNTNGFTINGLSEGNHRIQYTDTNNCKIILDLPPITDPDPITYTLTKVDPSCSDLANGSLTVSNIKGGYPNYVARWTRNGTPVPGNVLSITGGNVIYTLTITDQRFGKAIQTNIRFDNVPKPISFSPAIGNILCYNGKAKVRITATGGKPPYQYGVRSETTTTWYDTNTIDLPASAGSGYRFQVRERNNTGCETSISGYYPITQPTEIALDNTSVVNNNIFGGNQGGITITVSGGQLGHIISWSKLEDTAFSDNGLTIAALTAGNYIPSITDGTGSCRIVEDAIFVDEPEKLIVTIDNNTDRILCNGLKGGLIANATGGSDNYTYTWFKEGNRLTGETSASITDLTSGNYRVEVNDGFISTSNTAILLEPQVLELTISGTNPLCYNGNDGTVILNPQGGTPPYSYSIDNKQNYIVETSLTNQTIGGLKEGLYEVWIKDSNGCEITTPETITLTAPTEISIAEESLLDATTLGGNDGSIVATITGGTGDYTISWTRAEDTTFTATTTAISELFFGTYTLSVMDENNCSAQRSFVVLEPLPMSVLITLENPILCHAATNGILLASVTGGFPIEATPTDFEYRWFSIENGIETPLNTDVSLDKLSDLAAGTYKVVTNDAKGASAFSTFEITQPDDLIVSLDGEAINVLCHDQATGAIAIITTGGPKDEITGQYLPYSYEWTKEEDASFLMTTADLTGLTAGTYNLLVTDSNLCTVALEKIIIAQPDAPLTISNLQFENLTGYQTQNGSISMDVQGGAIPYEYQWINTEDAAFSASSQDLADVSKGTYQLLITDANNCTVSLEQVLIEPDELLITIATLSLEESVKCHGENTVLPLVTTTTGGFGTYSYAWYEQNEPTTVLFSVSDTPLVPAGTYTVVVTDENGNTASDTYTVSEPDVLKITEQVTDLLCNNDIDGIINTTITGGVTPYTYQWSSGQSTEDLSDLRAGSYTLTVQDTNGCRLSKTIEVRQPGALFANILRTYPSANGTNDGTIRIDMIGGTPPFNFDWSIINGATLAEKGAILNNTSAGKYAVTITDVNGCSLVIDDIDLFEPPILEVVVEQANVISCYGNTTTGSLIAIVEGGAPFGASKQYDYAWFDASTNLPIGTDSGTLQNIGAGSYYVTVLDALGTATTSAIFNLAQPDALQLDLTADFVNCGDQEDWTITASIQGGTPPYQYRWNTGDSGTRLENRIAGAYWLQIMDQRGCDITTQITLAPPAPLATTYSVIIPTCFEGCDGQVVLTSTGGTPPYQYVWSNGTTKKDLQGACAGTYAVTVTDAKGCQLQETMVIENPEQLIVDLGADITLCKNQSTNINAAIIDANATYKWTSDNGFSATTAVIEVDQTGVYSVLVTDSKGCTATDTIFVEATTNEIYTDFITNSQVFVGEKFLVFDISDPIPDDIQWTFPEGAAVYHQDSDYAELSFDRPGEYAIHMNAAFGLCGEAKTKKIVVIEKEFGQGESTEATLKERTKLSIYPNPTIDGRFTITIDMSKAQSVSLKVYGMGNNIILDAKRGSEKHSYEFPYDLSQLPGGIYFVLFETPSGDQVHKLIIE